MKRTVLLVALAAMALVLGCEGLRGSKPILMQKDYERMVVGRFDADYVGNDTCLKACHYHDQIRIDFEASTMGAQMSPDTGLPLVDCESCHGPGSLAIEGITEERVREDVLNGIRTECKHETFIDLKNLPAPAASLICLRCHSANATFNLHNWNAGEHALGGVSCSDCHNVHAGPDLIVRHGETYAMCTKCHEDKRAEFSLPSRHPVPEGRVLCINCHGPHGTGNDHLLGRHSVKEVCTQCHADKEGPFVYEHADLSEDCANCHEPHGSVNDNLLAVSVPFLCLECHEGHETGSLAQNATLYTRCTDCHSQIHGTDVPGVIINATSPLGTFTR